MRMPSTPMSNRDRSSDVMGSPKGGSAKAKGDKSSAVGSSKRNAGMEARKTSMAKRPRGKPIKMPGGQKTYHGR